ncbi:leucine--tRNA ligase [Wenyingzhuangia marina]|uniref:Leucine--tRNA ligase n=1 Tax=Wenyingzhuangia marina TaxID=1195760 RepID=A0A1M5S8V2_9FLAO|nr:class I tRNA ligase family protein [Wenyingzhuangia marina]GGF61304.1 leucine--tRNA ligase [Wenyingzhuangia marina]SHH34914.1 leucyl-tRNA synthetase [Wenyingzhuangia marina]
MEYNFNEIEAKWQKYWAKNQTFKAENTSDKPKFYALDMFPYPSGAGLHVGHPLGYIASDIFSRYKRHKGFNVLHPQGYDSFGLPAEQYAIQTGQHPAVTTETNVNTYRKQLDKIGFSFDWSREIRTSTPEYYKHTQWIFTELFNAWYNKAADKAEKIETLVALFEANGTENIQAVCDEDVVDFTASEWSAFSELKKQQVLSKYRLTYLSETEVNWCPALGTVLANDEIINGFSERGGHPVVRKKMMQWSMRISAYAQRLLDGLQTIDWPQPLKDAQTNWIGRSQGASVKFKVDGSSSGVEKQDFEIEVFTTRPDTIFGVTFMTLAPEHELVSKIVTEEQKEKVEAYIQATAKRSERERMADVKTISGAFTGAYAVHPFTGENIPIWIGDYVLASYGTGAVMAVPCGDQRDYDFAKHFDIEIKNIFEGVDISEGACEDKTAKIANSDFLSGLNVNKATKLAIYEMEQRGFGKGKINYRLRDAVFSRQRYWGEPFPVYYKDGMPKMIDKQHLPILLPEVEKYLPTEDGQPPLGNAEVWAWDCATAEVVSCDKIDNKTVFPLELNTMPGWAGSSWYFNRYMDANNPNEFASKEALDYWKEVDLYLGGSEHATGHLLYARFWQKFLYDLNYVPVEEFAKKLINQGMILGTSAFMYRIDGFDFNGGKNGDVIFLNEKSIFISKGVTNNNSVISDFFDGYLKNQPNNVIELNKDNWKIEFKLTPIHVDVSFVNASNELDIEAFRNWREEYKKAEFITESGKILSSGEDLGEEKYIVGREVEKMSKSKYNVVNPDSICEEYGADSLRLFEMFLGPLEQSKPWNTAGISGVHSFLKKLWRLYANANNFKGDAGEPSKEELKVLHKTIKKVQEDIENFSFNTSVSTFMIAVNELGALKCTKKEILEPLLILISPYAPHITEELWSKLGNEQSIATAPFPVFEPSHLVESAKEYPVSFNGKMRFKLELPLDLSAKEIENIVMAHEKTQDQLQGRTPKKVIIVPGKIINIVG